MPTPGTDSKLRNFDDFPVRSAHAAKKGFSTNLNSTGQQNPKRPHTRKLEKMRPMMTLPVITPNLPTHMYQYCHSLSINTCRYRRYSIAESHSFNTNSFNPVVKRPSSNNNLGPTAHILMPNITNFSLTKMLALVEDQRDALAIFLRALFLEPV